MRLVKVTQVGDSLGIVLPEDIVAKLGIQSGQVLGLSEAANGIELTVLDPEFETEMRIAEEIMDRYRETLRRLAK